MSSDSDTMVAMARSDIRALRGGPDITARTARRQAGRIRLRSHRHQIPGALPTDQDIRLIDEPVPIQPVSWFSGNVTRQG